MAHTVFVFVVAMQYGGLCGALALAAVAAMLIRVVSRLVPGAPAGVGSPTNELVRHMFFVLLLARTFSFDVGVVLAAVFAVHTASMLLPYRMPGLLRSAAKGVASIGLVNAALALAWLLPDAAPAVALLFFSTYFYGFLVGGIRHLNRAA